jgi:hypothetical protein
VSSGTGVVVPTRGSCDFCANHLECCERHGPGRKYVFRRICDKRAVVGLRKRREGATMPATRKEGSGTLCPCWLNQKCMGGGASLSACGEPKQALLQCFGNG